MCSLQADEMHNDSSTDPMKPSAVLFDLDNTLHDRDLGLSSFVSWQFFARGLGDRAASHSQWLQRFVDLDNGGKVWKDVVYSQLCQEFELSPDPADLLVEYEERFFEHVHSHEGLREMLSELKSQGWKTGIVTNGRPVFQRRTISALGIEGLVDTIVVSGECGLRKPDPAIFQLALSELGCEVKNSWFVGDDPVADIEGAKAVGFRTILFGTGQRRTTAAADFQVNQLSQVVNVLLRQAGA